MGYWTLKKKSIAFADDLIIYVKGKSPLEVQTCLQDLFDKFLFYFDTWRLTCNINKCETILFRPNVNEVNKKYYRIWREFKINTPNDRSVYLDHKNIVKYLGMWLDSKLKFNQHVKIAIDKAKKAYFNVKNLFHSKHLNAKVKMLCYMLLVRPVATYCCPTWYNISPSTMELLRKFKRNCFRACLKMYRTPESNYKKFYSCKKLYDKANITRIDSFILKLTRDHMAQASNLRVNSLIFGPFFPNPLYFEKCRKSGYIPPEAFTYLDGEGYIQNRGNIPILYHNHRQRFR